MSTTNTWGVNTNVGNFLDGSNWSLDKQPAAGQFDIIDTGDPTLENNNTIDAFTVDIVSGTSGGIAGFYVIGSTLGPNMLVEDAGSTDNNQFLLISGTVANEGTLLLNAVDTSPFSGFSLAFSNPTDVFVNTGTIDVTGTDGLFLSSGGYGTLINDGVINVATPRIDIATAVPIAGSGTIAIDNTTLEVSSDIGTTQTIEFTDGTSVASFDSARLGAGVPGSEGTVVGFQAGDLLDFGYLQFDGLSYDPVGRVLALTTDIGTLDITMGGAVPYTQASFTERPDFNNGFEIGTTEPPCFAAGTRIATQSGDVAVEHLAPGQYVHTLYDGLVPVRWVGHRRVACAHHPRPWNVRPVRIQAGAFGNGVPRRDLFLSPDHAVFVDGVLIPVRHLLNGATIAPVDLDEVTYYHVELPAHAILLAEGLPAESYLDTGNRAAFANGGGAPYLHPDFSRGVWQARGCADLIETGPIRDAVRQRLLERASALGHAMTDDPALRLLANGRAVPAARDGMAYRYRLPADTHRLRLVSRASVPAHMVPDCEDHRRLGVAVSRLMLDGRHVALTDPRLGDGWHAVDRDGGEGSWRWTDGDAALALRGRHLDIEVAIIEQYWTSRIVRSRRNAA